MNQAEVRHHLTMTAFEGLMYDEADEYGEAIAALTEALRLDPSNAIAYNNRGLAYWEIGMARLARGDFDRAVALADRDPVPLKNRARLSAGQGRHEDAIRDFTAILTIAPDDLPTYLARSEANRTLGLDAAAIADQKAAERIRATEPIWDERERRRMAEQRTARRGPGDIAER